MWGMNDGLLGIHHVTAIAGDPQTNVDFYSGLLGMRLVKISVNQDDVRTYHFFFGDENGTPGCDLTFFPHPGGHSGRPGAGQAIAVTLAVPSGSLDYWVDRLSGEAYPFDVLERFGEHLVSFHDPDGLRVEIVEDEKVEEMPGWGGGAAPQEHTVRVIRSVALGQGNVEAASRFLTTMLGFEEVAVEGDVRRLRVGASTVDLVPMEDRGRVAVGSIHHVAFRVADRAAQRGWEEKVARVGIQSSGIVDRAYFQSLYFREPGGVLFELATDGPGFTIDQTVDELGTRLALPPWLEPRRDEIERGLPPLRLPGSWAR